MIFAGIGGFLLFVLLATLYFRNLKGLGPREDSPEAMSSVAAVRRFRLTVLTVLPACAGVLLSLAARMTKVSGVSEAPVLHKGFLSRFRGLARATEQEHRLL
jgi:hypothetical protein